MSCNCNNHKKNNSNHEHDECCHVHSSEKTSVNSCGCGHCHSEEENPKLMIIRLITGGILFAAGMILKYFGYQSLIVFITAYLILGYDVLLNAVKDIKNIFNESFLMSIASLGAFAIGEAPEATAVMLFYQFGELLSDYAADKSKDAIFNLMDLRAETASVLKDGKTTVVPCEDVHVGETIIVSAGEKIPLDGVVTDGSAYVDMSAMTGESVPVLCSAGSLVLGGTINTNSVLTIQTTKEFSDSAASKILELVNTDKQAHTEKFITKIAAIYTPFVVLTALIVAVIPPLFLGDFKSWIYKALLFLVVSCPCALVVSVPITFFAGIGCLSKKGILVKGAYTLEKLSGLKAIAFDKTGTLTVGNFKVRSINANRDDFLKLTAHAEYHSSHPIAKAILNEYRGDIDISSISNYREILGKGVSALVDGIEILVGTAHLLEDSGVKIDEIQENAVYVSINGDYAGSIVISDSLKSKAAELIQNLKKEKIYCEMLTGDSVENAKEIAEKLDISYAAQLLPADKVNHLNTIKSHGTTAFVGDGLNDAPVLSHADVAFAMGGIGSDAAIEASDAVIIDDDIAKIPLSVTVSKKVMKIVKQNIVMAIGIKLIVMLLGLLGIASMWLGVFADVGVCILAVLNASRAFKD